MAIGFDKHPPGAFNSDPAEYGLGEWYGESGMMLTTQFFAMKIQRYLHDHDIDPAVLSMIAAKAYRNGARNPNAWRRTPLSVEEIAASPMVSDPLTKYMFCSPAEGARGARAGPRRTSSTASPHRPVWLRSPARCGRGVYGTFEVFSPSLAPERADGPHDRGRGRRSSAAGIGPDDIDVAQIQDTESGAELMHMAETGLCAHGEQVDLISTGADRDRRAAADQHRRRLPGQRRADRRVGAAPGARERAPAARRRRRSPGARRSAGRLHPRLRRSRASARARCCLGELAG